MDRHILLVLLVLYHHTTFKKAVIKRRLSGKASASEPNRVDFDLCVHLRGERRKATAEALSVRFGALKRREWRKGDAARWKVSEREEGKFGEKGREIGQIGLGIASHLLLSAQCSVTTRTPRRSFLPPPPPPHLSGSTSSFAHAASTSSSSLLRLTAPPSAEPSCIDGRLDSAAATASLSLRCHRAASTGGPLSAEPSCIDGRPSLRRRAWSPRPLSAVRELKLDLLPRPPPAARRPSVLYITERTWRIWRTRKGGKTAPNKVVIPLDARKQLTLVMRRAASLVPDLYAVDADYALSELCKDEQKLEKVLLGREFHVSLGRTVGIQVHQIDSLVAMLHQKFQSQQRYWMDFNKWEHFVNDDSTRSFLSLEVTRTGLPEISKQIHMVDEVYRLHGLPGFYKNPRPHISLVWALGDVSSKLKQATKEIEKFQNSISSSKNCNLRCNFSRVVCKVGKKVYNICKIAD